MERLLREIERLEEIREEQNEIVDTITRNIELAIERKEGYREKIVKSDEISRKRGKVNLKIYDIGIVLKRKYCGMRGA